jgi:hypothetical protein
MSALDQAVADLEARRAKDDAERNGRRTASSAFLKAFYEADIAPSLRLKGCGVDVVFDGGRILLRRPEEGVYAEGMMIVVGEQGEIDVNGRSLGPVADDDEAKKQELIAEIISHFSL